MLDAKVSVVTVTKLIDVSVTASCLCPDNNGSSHSAKAPAREPVRSAYRQTREARPASPSKKEESSSASGGRSMGGNSGYNIDMSKYAAEPTPIVPTTKTESESEEEVEINTMASAPVHVKSARPITPEPEVFIDESTVIIDQSTVMGEPNANSTIISKGTGV